MTEPLSVAGGVFLGSWLGGPLLFDRTFTEGFGIGVIAAILVFAYYAYTTK